MLTKKTIGFLGAGNLAEALIKGLLGSGAVSPAQIVASDRSKARLLHMAETYEVKVFNENTEAAGAADIVLLTVKPGDAPGVLGEVAPEVAPDKLLISVAAGLRTERILDLLSAGGPPHPVPVVRAMPNTPALVGEGMAALFAGGGATDRDLAFARAVFEAVGRVIVVDDEDLMDAVTGLSGSGPAYVFLFMEAMAEAGAKCGLGREDAETLALQTTLGAAALAQKSPEDLAALREMVTSPGGTTIEGLKRLEALGFRDAVMEAVEAAAKRARELSAF
ncbi:MAG: pyrroline-5-carboxylate reductase [Thermodesulfobacteriota bacterium]